MFRRKLSETTQNIAANAANIAFRSLICRARSSTFTQYGNDISNGKRIHISAFFAIKYEGINIVNKQAHIL